MALRELPGTGPAADVEWTLPPDRQPRWDLRRLLFGALILVGLAIPAGWLALTAAVGPSDGTAAALATYPSSNWVDGVEVTRVYGPGPIQEGDRVLAVDGVSLQDWVAGRGDLGPRPRVGDVRTYLVERDGVRVSVTVPLHAYPLRQALADNWPILAFELLLFLLSAFVVARRPRDLAARKLAALAVVMPIGFTYWPLSTQVIDLAGGRGTWPTAVGAVAWALLWGTLLPQFALLFPEPPDAVRRRPWLGALLYLVPLLLYGGYLALALPAATTELERLERWLSVPMPVQRIAPLLILGLIAWSYRRTSDRLMRVRMRWVLLSLLLACTTSLLFNQLPSILVGHSKLPWPLEPLLFLLCAVTLVAAILRYRLFDIEVILKRSLVYGGLTVALVLIYLGTVVLLRQLGAERGGTVALLAGLTVGLCFRPVQSRLYRLVSRVMYGERDDPYEVISQLGQLEAGNSPREVLPPLARTLAETLRLPYSRIELHASDGISQVSAEYGSAGGSAVVVPLTRQGAVIGKIVLEVGPGKEPFGPADLRLLRDVARFVGGAVHTALLAEALQRARERLVVAREEERRRLRRDLHDGLGPTLAASAMQLETARDALRSDPEAAERTLALIRRQTQDVLADIRRIVDDLRPPALDQFGLVGAIRERAAYFSRNPGPSDDTGFEVAVDASDADLDRLPAAVEVAAFWIAVEAINNSARHSGASVCTVRLWRDDGLYVAVRDNGRGVSGKAESGVGLGSMRERAAELGGQVIVQPAEGGGTEVCARLPVDTSREQEWSPSR